MTNDASAPIELYNLKNDIGEQQNIAAMHPDIVEKMANIMQKEHTPSEVFKFGFEKK